MGRLGEWSRLVAALLAVAFALGLTSCGGDDDGGGEPAPTPAEEAQQDDSTGGGGGDDGGAADDDATGEGDAQAGEQVFADNCSTCHGENGEGGGAAPSLQDEDLADDHDDVVEQVREGGGGMPAFGDQLSGQEIDDVAAYVTEVLAGP